MGEELYEKFNKGLTVPSWGELSWEQQIMWARVSIEFKDLEIALDCAYRCLGELVCESKVRAC